jgi:hypothetical protein
VFDVGPPIGRAMEVLRGRESNDVSDRTAAHLLSTAVSVSQ